LILGLALTLNFGYVSATDNSNNIPQNLQSTDTSNIANIVPISTTNLKATTSTTSKTTKYAAGSTARTSSTKTIRVLIYNGNNTIASCVTGVKTALTTANDNNLVPGYYFTYSTSKTITSTILSNYDILIMPGGTRGYNYVHSSSISAAAIKNFVSQGHGFLGICAGAYAGSTYVSGTDISYSGLGIAPHVNSKVYNHEGNLLISMTNSAMQILASSNTLTLAHYNGPAMYGNGFITFAYYTEGAYKGYAAIVGDTYGNGRAVLCGPHPELAPTNTILLSKLIVWAANVKNPVTTVTLNQINKAAKDVKAYVIQNHKIPVYITVGSSSVNKAQFLYFLTTSFQKVNSGSTSAVTVKSITNPSIATDTVKTGNIQKSELLTLARKITSYINANGRAPSYITCRLGNIRFENMIYMYSKVMAFYYSNGRLPSYVSITKWTYGS